MKIQDVKRECTAIVGISAEFSNSEIRSIDNLACKVGEAIERAIDQQVTLVREFQGQARPLNVDEDNVPVVLDLRDVERIHWFLSLFDNTSSSSMFDEADKSLTADIHRINKTALGDMPA
jgi:hypothetical protein